LIAVLARQPESSIDHERSARRIAPVARPCTATPENAPLLRNIDSENVLDKAGTFHVACFIALERRVLLLTSFPLFHLIRLVLKRHTQ